MYAVFEKTLLTDKGKALVRTYQTSFDAQKIYTELSEYAMKSTKAMMEAASLLSYITTTNLADGKWRGTTHAFILHWKDQVRKYHDLGPKQTLADAVLHQLLQNAVRSVAELRQVTNQADQFKIQNGRDLTYEEYCNLLLSAAQQYDTQRTSRAIDKAPKRRIYQHEFVSDDEVEDTFYDAGDFGIDQPIDTLEVNVTKYQGPRLQYEQWKALPDDAKKIWDMLSPEAKSIIL